MSHDRIRMVFHRPEAIRFVSEDKWKFTPVARWALLQKLAWWFLGKTKAVCRAWEETVEYKEVVIDRREVANTIAAAMREMGCAHIRPAEVFMGPESFDEAMREMPDSYSFEVTMGYNHKIFGLPVTIIPWMRGVVVVPERGR